MGDENASDAGFDRSEINGSSNGGDLFTLTPNGANARFARTNLVPFTIDLIGGNVEAVSVNGGGGDDQLAVAPGLSGLLVAADGGLGKDQLLTRDGAVDLVRGGAGFDRAQTDAVNVDTISGVEALDAAAVVTNTAPPGDTIAQVPTLGKVKVVRRGRQLVARVPVACPKSESGGCRVTLRLETAKPVRVGTVRAVLVLGSAKVSLGRGQSSTVSIRLAGGAAAVARRGKLTTRVRITSSDDAGNSASRAVSLRLRIPRA